MEGELPCAGRKVRKRAGIEKGRKVKRRHCEMLPGRKRELLVDKEGLEGIDVRSRGHPPLTERRGGCQLDSGKEREQSRVVHRVKREGGGGGLGGV